MVLFSGMRPQGNLEGMLTAQMVATHSAAMDFLSRATVEGLPSADRAQNLNHAMKLMSLYTRQIEVLDKHRGKGQQKVTVEYVNVESGGQAIVGHVEAGMLERQREGIAKAKAAGKYKGRAPTARVKSPEVMRLREAGVGASEIARKLGIGRASVYRILDAEGV